MPTYIVTQGDTFDLISRKVYGEQSQANLIRRSNPGIFEPLSPGTAINTPTDPSIPTDQPQELSSNNPSQVTISVGRLVTVNETGLGAHFDKLVFMTEAFTIWESVTITRTLDSLSTLALTAPFDPNNEKMQEFFRPFTFNEITVSVGGNKIFVGNIVNIIPQLSENRSTVTISAYSRPGIMADCTQPTSDYPLSWEQYTLKEIADVLSASFGVGVQFNEAPGDVFESVSNKANTTALAFLQDLAKQRNLVIGDTTDGLLLFHRSVNVGSPVARLEQGSAPLLTVTPQLNAQQSFSSVTGVGTTEPGDPSESFTVQTGIPGGRYHTFIVNDSLNTSLEEAVNAKAGRMFGNMIKYMCTVPTWFTANNELWRPNTTLKLLAPNAMVYQEYEFIIRRVELHRTSESETASLELVLPGSFSGEVPGILPWDS